MPSIRHLYEARLAIEVACARAAAERVTDQDLIALRRLLYIIESSTDPEAAADAEVDLHLGIARAADNPILVALLTSLAGTIRHAVHRPAGADSPRALARLVDALEAREPDTAARVMEDHLHTSIEQLFAASARAWR